jgi:uncharacterized protein YhaN
MKLLERAVALVTERVGGNRGEAETVEPETGASSLRRPVAAMRDEIARLKRHKDEFFDLAVRMEQQRDEWRDIHRDSEGKYHEGLIMFENALRIERVRNARLLVVLNRYREKDDKKPIKTPVYLDRELGIEADPIGRAKQYAEDVATLERGGHADHRKKRLKEGLPGDRAPDIDGKAERAAIAAQQDPECVPPKSV